MELEYYELDDKICFIKLIGTLDTFTAHCSGDNVRVIVDLSGVVFLASIGIRMITMNAKSLSSRGGKMVMLNPIPEVQGVRDIIGIPAIIPIYSSLESAETILLA